MSWIVKTMAVLAATLFATLASAQDRNRTPSRGQLLYENHCVSCHDSVVHVRDNRRAKSAGDIEYWVQRWSFEIGLGWNEDEINEVVRYLARRYYKLDKKG